MQNTQLLLCLLQFVIICVICEFIDDRIANESQKISALQDKNNDQMRPISDAKASKYWDIVIAHHRYYNKIKNKPYNITDMVEKETLRRTFVKLLKMIPDIINNKTEAENKRRSFQKLINRSSQSRYKKIVKSRSDGSRFLRHEVTPFVLNPYNIKEDIDKMLTNVKQFADIQVEVIGKTVNRLDILLLKVAKPKTDNEKKQEGKFIQDDRKKVIFIVHDLESNYFVNSSLQTYMLNVYTGHLENYDIYLMPMANPGGLAKNQYEAILGFDTFLNSNNKNNVPQGHCAGVNLERNFAIKWEKNHTISSCSDYYPGRRPLTEPESRAIRDVLQNHFQKIVAYISVTVGWKNGVYYPKAHSASPPNVKYLKIKKDVRDRIKKFTNYTAMTVDFDSLYNAHGRYFGSSVDYASEVFGIPYAMQFQLVQFDDNLKYLTDFYRHVVDGVLFSIRDQENKK